MNSNDTELLNAIYDFADFLKYKSELDKIGFQLLNSIKKEYTNLHSQLSEEMKEQEIIQKLLFVINCEYNTILQKFLQEPGNVHLIQNEGDILASLLNASLTFNLQSQTFNEKGYLKNSNIESIKDDKAQSVEENKSLSRNKEMQQLVVNKYIRNLSYYIQKIELLAISGKSGEELEKILKKLEEFEGSLNEITKADDVLIEEDNLKNLQEMNEAINSEEFQQIIQGHSRTIKFIQEFQTYSFKLVINDSQLKNKKIIENNPDIENYISRKSNDKKYVSSRNHFTPENAFAEDFFKIKSDRHLQKNEYYQIDIKPENLKLPEIERQPAQKNKQLDKSGKPVLFSSFFDKKNRSKYSEAKNSKVTELKEVVEIEGDNKVVMHRNQYKKSEEVEDPTSLGEERREQKKLVSKENDVDDQKDSKEVEITIKEEYEGQESNTNKRNEHVFTEKLSVTQRTENLSDLKLNKNILISEVGKNSKIGVSDLISQNSKGNSFEMSPTKKNINKHFTISQDISENSGKVTPRENSALKKKKEKSEQVNILDSFQGAKKTEQTVQQTQIQQNNTQSRDFTITVQDRYSKLEDNVFHKTDVETQEESRKLVNMKTLLDKNSELGQTFPKSENNLFTEVSLSDNYNGYSLSHTDKLGQLDNNSVLKSFYNREFNRLLSKFKRNSFESYVTKKSVKFVDDEFPPITDNIVKDWQNSQLKAWKMYEWRRISYLIKPDISVECLNENAELIDKNSTNPDLLTFLLSTVKFNQNFVSKFINKFDQRTGKLSLKSFIDNSVVLLDDFIPVKLNELRRGSEESISFPFISPILEGGKINIFFTIVEKYCAKKLGGYEKLAESDFNKLIQLFSKNIEFIKLDSVQNQSNNERLEFLEDLYEDYQDDNTIIYLSSSNNKKSLKFLRFLRKSNNSFAFFIEDFNEQRNCSFEEIQEDFDEINIVKFPFK